MIEKTQEDGRVDGGNMPLNYRNYLIPSSHAKNMCFSIRQSPFMRSGCRLRTGLRVKPLSTYPSYISLKNPCKSIMKLRDNGGGNRNNNSGNENGNAEKVDPATGERASGDMEVTESAGNKKNVSFADHKGLALAVVIDIGELSELSLNFSDVSLNTSLEAAKDGEQADCTDEPPLALSFKQPASDYLHFRDRLEKNCISLENVILKDYTVLGTIKVKNLSSQKRVFVRLTYDSWDTFIDASACLANVTQPAYTTRPAVFETFTFEIEIPANLNVKKIIEFAVCFEASDTQYWDNNDGLNYRILSSEWLQHKEHLRGMDSVSELRDCDSWSNFAAWDNVDTNMPYW